MGSFLRPLAEQEKKVPRFSMDALTSSEGRVEAVRSRRDLLLTCYDVLLECTRPQKLWQLSATLRMAVVRLKRHVQILLEAGLLRKVPNLDGEKKLNAETYMVTPLADYYFKALGDYYHKHRERKVR